MESDGDTMLDAQPLLRPQRPIFDGAKERSKKAGPGEVLVIAIGSHFVRYGPANASAPRKVRALAAFERKVDRDASSPEAVLSSEKSQLETHFKETVEKISQDALLYDRRRGGGKPIPWAMQIEPVDMPIAPEDDTGRADVVVPEEDCRRGQAIYIGRTAEKLLHSGSSVKSRFDIVAPIVDSRMAWHSEFSRAMIRAALDAILRAIGNHFHSSLAEPGTDIVETAETNDLRTPGTRDRDPQTAKKSKCLNASTNIALIAPDCCDRSDVAEIIGAIFRVHELQAAAVFVHHSSVSCSLGAGLPTCVVIDIGFAGTSVCCVEEGSVIGDSRAYLHFGSRSIIATFETLLMRDGRFSKTVEVSRKTEQSRNVGNAVANLDAGLDSYGLSDDDVRTLCIRTCEQLCSFNVDENDVLGIAMVRTPSSGRMFRVKCGVGIRTIPALGLFYPRLFEIVSALKGFTSMRLEVPGIERNANEDNFMLGLFDDIKRSTIVSAAKPFGVFANEMHNGSESSEDTLHPSKSSLADAIIWSVQRGVESTAAAQGDSTRKPDLMRRYFNSVLLAGGGSSIDGIALALEARLKQELDRRGIPVHDVTVIDGAKGKGDEELLSAAALLKKSGGAEPSIAGLDDEGDPASLAWKGGAVMVEADAVKDLWVYRDEWDSRGIRAFRERAPFFW